MDKVWKFFVLVLRFLFFFSLRNFPPNTRNFKPLFTLLFIAGIVSLSCPALIVKRNPPETFYASLFICPMMLIIPDNNPLKIFPIFIPRNVAPLANFAMQYVVS